MIHLINIRLVKSVCDGNRRHIYNPNYYSPQFVFIPFLVYYNTRTCYWRTDWLHQGPCDLQVFEAQILYGYPSTDPDIYRKQ